MFVFIVHSMSSEWYGTGVRKIYKSTCRKYKHFEVISAFDDGTFRKILSGCGKILWVDAYNMP